MKLIMSAVLTTIFATSSFALATVESTVPVAASKKANVIKSTKVSAASPANSAVKSTNLTPSKSATTNMIPSASSATTSTTRGSSFEFEENKSELFLSATQAEFNTSNGFSNLEISGMYAYLIQDQIQAGAAISLGSSSYSRGSSTTSTNIYALGIYNFQPTINEAIFAFAGLGVATMPSGYNSSSTKVGLKIGAGKRFPLWAKIQYVPTASIEKIGDFDPIIRIVPVNFSLIF